MPKAPRQQQISLNSTRSSKIKQNSNPGSNPKPQPTPPPPQNTSLLRAQFDLLSLIWPRDPRIPSVESRRAWALARGLNPTNVHAWWYRRRKAAKRLRVTIPKETYELDVEEGGWAVDDGSQEIKKEEDSYLEGTLVGDTALPSSDGLELSSASTLPVVPVSDPEEAIMGSDDTKIAHISTKRHNTRAYIRFKTALYASSDPNLLSCSSPIRSSPGLPSSCFNFGSRYSSLPPSSPPPELESRSPSPTRTCLYLCASPSPSAPLPFGPLFDYSMRTDENIDVDVDLDSRMDKRIQIEDDCELNVLKIKDEGETRNCVSDLWYRASGLPSMYSPAALRDEWDMGQGTETQLVSNLNIVLEGGEDKVDNSDAPPLLTQGQGDKCDPKHTECIPIEDLKDYTCRSQLVRKPEPSQCTSNVVLPLNHLHWRTWRQHFPLLFRPQYQLRIQLQPQFHSASSEDAVDSDICPEAGGFDGHGMPTYMTWCLDGYRVACDGAVIGVCSRRWDEAASVSDPGVRP